MAFRCARCGTCCMYLGDYLVIEREIAPFEFACCFVSTGTEFTARIDEDRRDLFLDRRFSQEHPRACPFLRPEGSWVICTIHETSPEPCRAYRCVILQISTGDGRSIGKVHGTFGLFTGDPSLRADWEEAVCSIPLSSPDAEVRLQRFLEARGYRVE